MTRFRSVMLALSYATLCIMGGVGGAMVILELAMLPGWYGGGQ